MSDENQNRSWWEHLHSKPWFAYAVFCFGASSLAYGLSWFFLSGFLSAISTLLLVATVFELLTAVLLKGVSFITHQPFQTANGALLKRTGTGAFIAGVFLSAVGQIWHAAPSIDEIESDPSWQLHRVSDSEFVVSLPQSFKLESDSNASSDKIVFRDSGNELVCEITVAPKLATRNIQGYATNAQFRIERQAPDLEAGPLVVSELSDKPFSRQDFTSLNTIIPVTLSLVCLEIQNHFVEVIFGGNPESMDRSEEIIDQIIRSIRSSDT